MRFGPLRLVVWFTCALLAAAAPAAAWDAARCWDTDGPKAFRDKIIGILTDTNWGFLEEKDQDFDKYKQGAYDTILGCQKSLSSSENGHFNSCMSRVQDYAKVISRSQDDGRFSLGLDVDNYTYYTQNKKILEIPSCLNKSTQNKELFEALNNTTLSKEASVERSVNLIKQRCKDAVVVPYVSQTVTSLDGGNRDKHGRIVVLIRDNDTSHYVQFTVDTGDTPVGSRRQASVVKVSKTKGTFIFDWQRTANNEFAYTGPRIELFGNDQHCYTCHWSGVLAIHPFQVPTKERPDVGNAVFGIPSGYEKWLTSLNTKYKSATDELNKQIKEDTLNSNLQKVVGSPSLFDEKFPNLLVNPSEACPAEKTAMSQFTCNGCHQNRGKAIFELKNYGDMINKYVAGGLMPPNNTASADIRKAASQCFQKAAAAKMTTWLEGTDCPQ
jgi:hypothetical protein